MWLFGLTTLLFRILSFHCVAVAYDHRLEPGNMVLQGFLFCFSQALTFNLQPFLNTQVALVRPAFPNLNPRYPLLDMRRLLGMPWVVC